jgi:cytochrome P450
MTDPAGVPDLQAPVFDPLDPRWSSDPFPLYADLRRNAPIHRNELGFWVLSRHSDCLTVLRDRRSSSDSMNMDQGGMPERFRRPVPKDSPEYAGIVAMQPFIFRDPPDHTRLRSLVALAFTPRVVESLREHVQVMVDELLDAALDAGHLDLVAEFAAPLPVRTICDLLGVPVEDHPRFGAWSEALARGLDPDFLLTDDVIAARGLAALEIIRYFHELIADRRRSPGTDLMSRLIDVEDDGTVLSETELISTCILLLAAGHETTVNLIAGGMLALLDHPDQLERFREDPGVERTAVEEMMRYVSPVQLTTRTFTEDCVVADTEFRRGDFAMVLLASANRDEAVFDRPEEFDITRSPNNHLGLGFGIHHCLGAPLARMETRMALASLVRRAPKLALATDDVRYKSNVILRGMDSLPVSMHG